MVSPSPLVSWHAECTQEGGRSLFMLTPLPKPSAFTSKLKKSSKSVFKNITNDLPVATSEFSSPEKVLKRNNTTNNDNNSIIVSTPYLKMSPPKSCILLEPASEHYNKKTNGGVKNAAINGGGDSEPSSSSSQGYGHLGVIEVRQCVRILTNGFKREACWGESLKKELWMRFEAATGHELRFKASVGTWTDYY
ncbi:unnamed protein product [Lactuca virosa]|uniref:Uncharacterized protein n=1 Tax=Lactuca virosa TaxID=75947 RepID=A0AAU9MAY3_9ASTR|nr:unnamed protein product [Lactuca virosa]